MGLKSLAKPVFKPTSFLGFDASTKSAAFGLIIDDKLVKWGIINYEGKDRFQRLVDSKYKVAALMKDIGHVDVITQEQAVGSINQKTGLFLAQAYGATMTSMIESCTVYEMVNPNVWQQALGVKPKLPAALKKEFPDVTKSQLNEMARVERKKRNVAWVNDKYNLNLKYEDNDVCDAIAVSDYGRRQYL